MRGNLNIGRNERGRSFHQLPTKWATGLLDGAGVNGRMIEIVLGTDMLADEQDVQS